MSIKDNKGASVPREYLRNRIRVFSYDRQNPEGMMVNPLYKEPLVFHNGMQLLMLIEKNMNDVQHPQSMISPRRLHVPEEFAGKHKKEPTLPPVEPPVMPVPENWRTQEPLEEFVVQVMFRSISGWEGIIECSGSNEMLSFHSEIELLSFMDQQLRKVSG